MLMVIDNYDYLAELTDEVVNNPSMLDGMHINTLDQLTTYAVEEDDFRVLDILTEIHTGISMKSDRMPDWFKSGFDDDITEVKFEHQKKSKFISWREVRLDDGERLTSKKHKPLLNAFKYWIIACDDLSKILSPRTVSRKFDRVLTLINTILLNGEAVKLSQFHLQNISESFWLNILVTIAENKGWVISDLFQVNERIKNLLNNVDVSDEEAEEFKRQYPYITRKLASDEVTLNLKDRVKACCWLHQQRYYAGKGKDLAGHQKPDGNNAILTKLLFKGKILPTPLPLLRFPELALKPDVMETEYKAVPNQERGKGSSKHTLTLWLNAIQLINNNLGKSDTCTINLVTSEVSVATVKSLIKLRKQGRTKTLPPEFVFDLFRSSYELLKRFCPPANEEGMNFWSNMLEVLTEVKNKSVLAHSNLIRPHCGTNAFDKDLHQDLPSTERGHWIKFEAINVIHSDFLKQGVLQFDRFNFNTENRHNRIRNNESMLELFSVLLGAIQLLVGSITARRQDELVSLEAYGNLVFITDKGQFSTTANPYSEECNHNRWYLRFKVKKTGVKGHNAPEDRPIPISVARFLWQLEQFNLQAVERGLNKGKLSLFNYVDSQTFKLIRGNLNQYNSAFNALCDYFETAIVEMDNGEYRRYYVRQHQLRRFFALVFFWSESYENMEALRWMLAHSDLEHLHHYITESDTGAVINSAKASTIVQSVISDKSLIENYDEVEKLREMIAKRVSGDASKMLHINTLDDAIFDYEEEDEYSTIPHISQLQAEQELEDEVLTLLENDVISLEPEFFTVKNEDGEDIKTFNLILKVNQLEAEL
ncbi:integrase [Vibrio diabolicus]|uniref:integrase n=1 Tax=Vibrio diabolicus TaxID=50719 RepID=UPI00215F7985|nr:integrase [Vibrio diabolicus]MCS0365213.1 integrase [Vibrio diabolicus]